MLDRTSGNYLYILFRVRKNIFAVSCEYILDIEAMPAVEEQKQSPMQLISDPYGRVITAIDLGILLNLPVIEKENTASGVEKSLNLIVLDHTPYKCFLADQIIGLETTADLLRLDNSTFENKCVCGYFHHIGSREIITELNVPGILERVCTA